MAVYETTISSTSVQQWWKDSLDGLTADDLLEPREVVVELTDEETLEKLKVKALVCVNPERLPGADTLRVRDFVTDKYIQNWAVKILEHYEEPEVQIEIKQDKRRLSQMKGDILKSLLDRGEKQ